MAKDYLDLSHFQQKIHMLSVIIYLPNTLDNSVWSEKKLDLHKIFTSGFFGHPLLKILKDLAIYVK